MENVKLKELVDIFLGVTHTPEYVFAGVPFLSVKDISDGEISFDDCKYISQEEYDSLSEGAKPKVGDMLFCRVGTLGKPIIIPEGTPVFGSFVSLGYLRNKDASKCDMNYLRYWMYSNSFWQQVNANVKGASQVNLNTGWLSKFDVVLPEMEQQKYRIATLEQCDMIIRKRKQQIEELDTLIKARFVEMFGDPIQNPFGWQKKRFDEICENLDSRRKPITSSDRVEGIYPYYGASGIVDYVEDYIFDEDILLVSEDGANLLMRSTPIAFSVSGKVWVNNHAHVVRFEKMCLQKYIEIFFSLIDISDSITGSAQPKLNQAKLNAMEFPIPEENLLEDYLGFLKQVDKSKVAVQKALNEAKLLFDSLMQEYFG